MVYRVQLKQGCLRTITRTDDANAGQHRGWSWRIHAPTPAVSLNKPFTKHANSLRVAFATLSDFIWRGKSGRVGTMGCQFRTCAVTKGLGGGVKISARL